MERELSGPSSSSVQQLDQEDPFLRDAAAAHCLVDSPYASEARWLISASRAIGRKPAGSVLRAWCVARLFGEQERLFTSGEEPVGPFRKILGELSYALESAARAGLDVLGSTPSNKGPTRGREVETVTGDHYGKLFRAFSDQSYWNEPTQLLRTRLLRNGLEVEDLAKGEILDAGCGGGRYTVAWRLMGARLAIGVDFSESGISDACQRLAPAGIGQVRFIRGNVLALPFPSDRFDVVFSNGVLHHTSDWKSGVEEVLRVLRPGGLGWLYLIERPGGLFWDMIEIMRVLMAGESREAARAALATIGIPANRIFYMLDHVLVPINVRLTPEEVETALALAGASDVRRLERGTDFDRVERIHRGHPFARVHYGVGENRYVFSKP